MPRLKLHNFSSDSLLGEFISHLDTIVTVEKFTFVRCGGAVLLDFNIIDVNSIYYKDWPSTIGNDPIVCLGVNVEVEKELSQWDHEALDMKSFV